MTQVMPVAVAVGSLLMTEGRKVAGLIFSENVIVKLTGTELLVEGCAAAFVKLVTAGFRLSWV